jgi:hypothetical protein
MATPSYKGTGQPQADSSFWSGLGSWFGGGSTPAYAGVGQPSSGSSGYLSTRAPAYTPVPSSGQSPASAIAPAVFPPGQFAIVIPRGLVPPCDVVDPQQ